MSREPFPERPRAEPEIILPDEPMRYGRTDAPRVRVFVAGAGRGASIPLRKPGPLTIAVLLLGAGLVFAVLLFLLLSALVIALPAAVVLLSAALAVGVLRGGLARALLRRFFVRR